MNDNITKTLTRTDKWRIERAVWAVDSGIQDLPRRTRVAKRRELRDNLRAAAQDVGTLEALHRLGDLRKLAAEYLAAEYGDWGPRPSWVAGFTSLILFYLSFTWLLEIGTSAFRSGVVIDNPDVTGTFIWNGIPYLLDEVTFTFVDGDSTSIGGAWTPLTYLGLFAAAMIVGKLWRLLPGRTRVPKN